MTEIPAWAVLLDQVNVVFGLNDIKTLDNVGMIKIFMNADLFSEQIQQKSFDFGEIQYFDGKIFVLSVFYAWSLVHVTGITFSNEIIFVVDEFRTDKVQFRIDLELGRGD